MTYAGSPASRWPRMGPGWWVFVVTSDGSSSNIAFLSFVRARGQWTIKETSPTSHHLHSGVNFGQSARATAVVMSVKTYQDCHGGGTYGGRKVSLLKLSARVHVYVLTLSSGNSRLGEREKTERRKGRWSTSIVCLGCINERRY